MTKKTESVNAKTVDLGSATRVDAVQPNGRAAKIVKSEMAMTRKVNREAKRESVSREDNY